MSKPRLSKRVLAGLASMRGLIEAGDIDDALGCDWESADAGTRQAWLDIQAACEWIWKMQTHREQEKAERATKASTPA